jgi:hypothetical protein
MLAVTVLAAATLLCPVEATARVTIGIEAIAASGTHYEGPGTVSEQFVAPAFHLTLGGSRIELQAEGIPLVGLSTSGLPSTTATSATDLGSSTARCASRSIHAPGSGWGWAAPSSTSRRW